MKFINLVLLTLGVLVLNPRIDFEALKLRPKSIISCSTGWSFQWGKGLIGFYSLETASEIRSSSFFYKYNQGNDLGKLKSLNYKRAKESIMRPCR